MIYFSSDVDWAPEPVIEDLVNLFISYGQSCTFFATHKSDVLNNLQNNPDFEIGIHPNFNSLLLHTNHSTGISNAEIILDNLLEIYPLSKGVRSHSTTVNSILLDLFYRKGLIYDSNIFLPYQKVQPFKLWNGFTRIPYNWEDDVHFLYKKSFNSIDFENDDLIILDFHPIHVFLNTDSEERYLSVKPYYQDFKELKKRRNNDLFGARTLLINMLENLKICSAKTNVLSSLV